MKTVFFCIILLSYSISAHAYDVAEKDWGIAMGIRNAKIPYPTNEERVNDVIPLLFYDGETFFIRGLTGGVKLVSKDQWQFSAIGRYRYFDIPAEYQNMARGNAIDLGGQIKYKVNSNFETNLEIMADEESRFYSALNARYRWESGSWELFPYATLRLKSARFNDHYFGLDGFTDPANPTDKYDNKIGAGFDLTLGSEIRYHVISNFYLIGSNPGAIQYYS